jgi:ABC-type nitrate/sulfonate/bicarbonate transport system ATPase subunit
VKALPPHIAELRDVRLRFGEKVVLDGVSLAADPQERLVIIGQSGMGKTNNPAIAPRNSHAHKRVGPFQRARDFKNKRG